MSRTRHALFPRLPEVLHQHQVGAKAFGWQDRIVFLSGATSNPPKIGRGTSAIRLEHPSTIRPQSSRIQWSCRWQNGCRRWQTTVAIHIRLQAVIEVRIVRRGAARMAHGPGRRQHEPDSGDSFAGGRPTRIARPSWAGCGRPGGRGSSTRPGPRRRGARGRRGRLPRPVALLQKACSRGAG